MYKVIIRSLGGVLTPFSCQDAQGFFPDVELSKQSQSNEKAINQIFTNRLNNNNVTDLLVSAHSSFVVFMMGIHGVVRITH